MTRKLTRITKLVDGYAVVVVQNPSRNNCPGAYIGCFLQTPENPENGPFVLLSEAMAGYIKHTNNTGSVAT